MIVRNEAAHLPACLESIRELVDEIVIVDTGSTDDTVAIARSYGAVVREHPWQQDFATPRNLGLDLARGRWILYIDADERARALPVERFRARLETAPELALRVRLRLSSTATPAWEYRLWRSDPRIRFRGVMHEKVTPAISEVAAADRLQIGESELCLDHFGYEGDQTHKHRRNLPLLRAELAADPTNPYIWHHLARVLEALDLQEESDIVLERALEVAREHHSDPAPLVHFEVIRRQYARGTDVTEALAEARAAYPDNLGLAWLQVLADIDGGHYEQALRLLEWFEIDPEMPAEDAFAYAEDMFGAHAAAARAISFFRLGRYADAAQAYREAERLEPQEESHRLKRILSEHRAALEDKGGSGRTSRDHEPDGPFRGGPAWRWQARELTSGLGIDVGGVPVELRATDSRRAHAMWTLLGRLPRSDRPPEATLTFGRHAVPLPQRDPDEQHGNLLLWHGEGEVSMALGLVSARVSDGHGTIGGYTPNLQPLFRHTAPFMLAPLLAPHGSFILHAAAVQRGGRAVLVLGGSGSGKSTLALAALQHGWSVLSDDLVVLRGGAHGPEVCGLPNPLNVPSEVLPSDSRPSDLDDRGRTELPFEAWDRRWHPVGTVAEVWRGDAPDAQLEPVDSKHMLAMLIASMLSRQPADVRAYTRVALALCRLPTFRLLHSAAPERRLRAGAEALAGL